MKRLLSWELPLGRKPHEPQGGGLQEPIGSCVWHTPVSGTPAHCQAGQHVTPSGDSWRQRQQQQDSLGEAQGGSLLRTELAPASGLRGGWPLMVGPRHQPPLMWGGACEARSLWLHQSHIRAQQPHYCAGLFSTSPRWEPRRLLWLRTHSRVTRAAQGHRVSTQGMGGRWPYETNRPVLEAWRFHRMPCP